MFENLTERLSQTVAQLRSKGRLTEEGISETLREVRIALLEADVALPVVQTFIKEVREKAVGQEILKSLTPGQAMVKLVHDELVAIMGTENEALDLRAQPPVAVLMAGLQGSGKTTTTAKLASRLTQRGGKRILMALGAGLGFQIVNQLTANLGLMFKLSPALTSLAPIALALVFAAWLLTRSQRHA